MAFSAKLGEAFVDVIGRLSKLQASLARAQIMVRKSLTQIGQAMTAAGRAMTTKLTAPILLFGAGILKASAEFEKQMNRVQAVSGASASELKGLNEQAKLLGRTTQFSAGQAANAMGFLAQAGFNANQIISAMPSTLQLAAAASLDLAQAADITSNILAGFGLAVGELQNANDVLVATFTNTNTNLSQLGEAMKFVGPVAKAAGLSFNETAAALGLLGNAGIQGSLAGTTLRGALSKLINPSKEASKIIKRLGLNAVIGGGSVRSLSAVIKVLEREGLSAADAMEVFGLRAGPGMLALVEQGSKALDDLKAKLNASGGIAARIAEVQLKGLAGQLTKLKSAAEGLAIAIGDAGVLGFFTKMFEKLTGLISKLAEADPKFLALGASVAGIVAVTGPLLLLLGGFAQALTFLIGPGGLIIGIIAAIGFGIGALANTLKGFKPALEPVIDLIAALFKDVKAGRKSPLEALKTFLKEIPEASKDLRFEFFVLFERIKDKARSVFNTMKDSLVASLKEIATELGKTITAAFDSLGRRFDALVARIRNTSLGSLFVGPEMTEGDTFGNALRGGAPTEEGASFGISGGTQPTRGGNTFNITAIDALSFGEFLDRGGARVMSERLALGET